MYQLTMPNGAKSENQKSLPAHPQMGQTIKWTVHFTAEYSEDLAFGKLAWTPSFPAPRIVVYDQSPESHVQS